MSFVSKGEKKMRNMARKAGPSDGERAPLKDSFGRKGDGDRSGAPHNMAKGSMDRASEPVSGDADGGRGYDEKVSKSEYDPASGKRAKSVADLRSALKKINERSMAGEASPTGSEGGEDAKHTSSSKNESGFMKTSKSSYEKETQKKPRGQASQMEDEEDLDDPMDDEMSDDNDSLYNKDMSDEPHEGMTPKGKKRKNNMTMKKIKERIAR